MASYFVTGVSRGLGFEMLRQLSSNPSNTIVGLVRDKVSTEKEVSQELPGRKNIHIVHGDITNYASLQKAVQETAAITGGSLDYVIANAASLAKWSAYKPIGALGAEPQKLEEHIHEVLQTNLIGDIHLFNLTIPLIQAGRIKKIIAISSGHADADIAAKYEVSDNAIYAISKAALNMAIAKFSAQYAKEGILFLGVSPGVVDTGNNADVTDEEMQSLGVMHRKFMAYAPHFKGPSTAEEAVKLMVGVWERASVDRADGGTSVSQFGNKQWL